MFKLWPSSLNLEPEYRLLCPVNKLAIYCIIYTSCNTLSSKGGQSSIQRKILPVKQEGHGGLSHHTGDLSPSHLNL
jgi:hypothetical protein